MSVAVCGPEHYLTLVVEQVTGTLVLEGGGTKDRLAKSRSLLRSLVWIGFSVASMHTHAHNRQLYTRRKQGTAGNRTAEHQSTEAAQVLID